VICSRENLLSPTVVLLIPANASRKITPSVRIEIVMMMAALTNLS
jgi:hypothetical protein